MATAAPISFLQPFTSEELSIQMAKWDAFLAQWPVERLSTMSLDEYSQVGRDNSFTRWIELQLDKMGSIWGGSSFKFGIYHRDNTEAKLGGRGRTYTEKYAWYTKYGESVDEAFHKVRGLVETVAKSAAAGTFEDIDSIDLGDAYKWKIAFHYQNRKELIVTPVFNRKNLLSYLGESTGSQEPQSSLYRRIAINRGDKEILNFGRQLWNDSSASIQKGVFTVEHAEELLTNRFGPSPAPSEKMAGFSTANGRELALRRKRKEVRLFVDIDCPRNIPGVTVEDEYDPKTSRSSNIPSQAPKLALGNSALLVSVASADALEALCDAYSTEPGPTNSEIFQRDAIMEPLNQILYGPPGTGKTFHTVTKALAILDPTFLAAHQSDRRQIKARFDELVAEKRIRFVTFHQSFSYEDFVEGIRARTNDEDQSISYEVQPGIFQRIVQDAFLAKKGGHLQGVNPDAKVWKISIDVTGSSKRRERCFEQGEMRIGWDKVGDLSDPARPKAQIDAFEAESAASRNSLFYFSEGMKIGDLVLCLKSQSSIQAVGIITSDYQFDGAPAPIWKDFVHYRKVNWIKTNLDVNIVKLNGNTQLTMKTVYLLNRISAADAIGLAGLESTLAAPPDTPYVLIIDEINRGNISRIFGELITLLEPSKRAGRPEALRLTLPYSQTEFQVPDNLYVIGTMNTADRSLTGLDIALRRRFNFIEMPPSSELLAGVKVGNLSIKQLLETLNERIETLLDRDHRLGHTYFLPLKSDDSLTNLANIFRCKVIPLLQEYFFEDWERIHWVLNDHRKPLNLQFIREAKIAASKLFGEQVGQQIDSRRWEINQDAFTSIESYEGIL